MAQLTPLEQVPGIDEATRRKLAEQFWINSAEEFVSAARGSNAEYGNGLAALGVALSLSPDAVRAMFDAAQKAAPGASSFQAFPAIQVGAGLDLTGLGEPPAGSFSVVSGRLPSEVAPLAKLPAPPNQGQRNTCVAFTLAACVQTLSGDPTDLSEQFLYWLCKQRDRIPGDTGTNPLVALQALRERGVCSEATWPYSDLVDHQNPGHAQPSETAFAEALRRRITGFKQLPARSVPHLQQALSQGKPLLIGLKIYESWLSAGQARKLGKLRRPLPGEQARGGHAMCVLGYRNDASAPGGGYFIVRNSWGAGWATENSDGAGYCWVPYQLIAEQCLVAFAVEGVQTAADGGGASTPGRSETPQPGARRPVGALGGSAEGGDALQAIYQEALELQERVAALVGRLGALIGEPAADAEVDEADAEEAEEAEEGTTGPTTDQVLPKAHVYRGPLTRLASEGQGAGKKLLTNGIDGRTGQYLLQIDAETASRLAANFNPDTNEIRNAREAKVKQRKVKVYGTIAGVDPKKIYQSRWAVVVSHYEDAELLKKIWPLIEHRMGQMEFSKRDFDFRPGESCGDWYNRHTDNQQKTPKSHWGQIPPVLTYRPGEAVNIWLARHGPGPGPVNPKAGVPYYLMLLGRPGPLNKGDEAYIPLEFQYELDIFFAVGRLCFTGPDGRNLPDDYTRYAERVVAFERASDAASRLSKEFVYFGTRHNLDGSTEASADQLITPLSKWHAEPDSLPALGAFGQQLILGPDASRSNLERALRGGDAGRPPAMIFTATHGIGLPFDDKELVMNQGGLVTKEWTGIGGIEREHYYTGADLPDISLDGSFALLFACYGGGCPLVDEFVFDENLERLQIAPFPFIAQLPQRMLARGCLAVLGHVERAWTHSFTAGGVAEAQIQPFQDIIGRLLEGRPVGDALDEFNVIQGQRASVLAKAIDDLKFLPPEKRNPFELASLWEARNDARNYALLGDPAVRMPFPPVVRPDDGKQ